MDLDYSADDYPLDEPLPTTTADDDSDDAWVDVEEQAQTSSEVLFQYFMDEKDTSKHTRIQEKILKTTQHVWRRNDWCGKGRRRS